MHGVQAQHGPLAHLTHDDLVDEAGILADLDLLAGCLDDYSDALGLKKPNKALVTVQVGRPLGFKVAIEGEPAEPQAPARQLLKMRLGSYLHEGQDPRSGSD